MPDEKEQVIHRYALLNAVEHEGMAQSKSVLGKVLADNPEWRNEIVIVRNLVEDIVRNVNRLSLLEQRQELGSEMTEKEKKSEKKSLPELDRKRNFVVRFAPNPDGTLHIGNARVAVLNHEYAKKYKGKFILRFDDTDPKVKIPEKKFYTMIKQDLKWLGISWSKEVIASKRIPVYYNYAEKLIAMEKAYVCTCCKEWAALRDKGKACPCRNLSKKEHMKRWKAMIAHRYREGEAVLRIKTDLDLKNPAVRDWPAMRIVDNPKHPLTKRHLWPLYNFASAIDDHLLGITHIMRGQEHSTNEAKQKFIYQYFGWSYPVTTIVGRFSMSDMVMSKSLIRRGIAERKFTGWDDPSIGTLRALKRRGFLPKTIKEMIVEIGLKPNDITISMENLSAFNRKNIDDIANRYFFVPNPKKIEVKKMTVKDAKIPLHPSKKRGFRTFRLTKIFYIDREDFEKYQGLEVRLKDLCNIRLQAASEFTSKAVKNIPKIQWVSHDHVPVRVIMPGHIIKGYGEHTMRKLHPGDIIQMERFGFGKVEKAGKDNIVICFSHR
ncbi:MAG: glutamate--tRNA ligase [Candidatus Aenigmarchaeota archaeon]|nr:glutamate--tRNA ligase [Candidatus Aenigmarchaeota archaeon]